MFELKTSIYKIIIKKAKHDKVKGYLILQGVVRPKKPSLTLNLGINGGKVTSEPTLVTV